MMNDILDFDQMIYDEYDVENIYFKCNVTLVDLFIIKLLMQEFLYEWSKIQLN